MIWAKSMEDLAVYEIRAEEEEEEEEESKYYYKAIEHIWNETIKIRIESSEKQADD